MNLLAGKFGYCVDSSTEEKVDSYYIAGSSD